MKMNIDSFLMGILILVVFYIRIMIMKNVKDSDFSIQISINYLYLFNVLMQQASVVHAMILNSSKSCFWLLSPAHKYAASRKKPYI